MGSISGYFFFYCPYRLRRLSAFRNAVFCAPVFFAAVFFAAGAAVFLGVGGDVRADRSASAFRKDSRSAAVRPRPFNSTPNRFNSLLNASTASDRVIGFFRAGFRFGVGIFLPSLRLLLRLLLRLRVSWCGLVSASSGRVWHDSSSMPPAYEASRCWHASLRWDPIGSR